MESVLRGLTLFACAAVLSAQAPPPPQADGLDNDWDIAVVLGEIGDHALRLLPQLDKVNVNSWVLKGASDTYMAQLQSCKEQARALADGAKALARNPQKLSASLELFFRMHGLEQMLSSLEEGIRKYQGPNDAQALIALEAENGANRDRFEHYIVNLASDREHDLQVMDREAQRCRGTLSQSPSRPGRKK